MMAQIITHDWNGYGISQLKENTRIAKYEIPQGYVNATQMCKANAKQWGHYAERKASKTYWQGLADDLGIPISSLIIQVDAYGDEQATWVHPEVATDLAQWVSTPFRIWANRTLTRVINGEAIQQQPQSLAETILMIGQQMVENERRQKELESRLAEYDQKRLEAEEDMKAIPEPTADAPEITTRMQISRLIRDYSVNKGCSFSQVWAMVYRDFRDRFHVDLQQRSQNTGGKQKPLDICEQLGLLEQLYASASVLLR